MSRLRPNAQNPKPAIGAGASARAFHGRPDALETPAPA